jgi:hypothetical protein
MPPNMIILTFRNMNDGIVYSYCGYTSTDGNRSLPKVRRDIYYQLGYQESYPNDRTTLKGWLEDLLVTECGIAYESRSDLVQCVLRPNQLVHSEYPPIEYNTQYPIQVPLDEGQIYTIPHFYIQPNEMLDATSPLDSDSDSDSD